MNIEEMKKARLKEKAKEYKRNRSNPDPMSYSIEALIEHFIAEVGKFTHSYYHRCRGGISTKDFADVSNLHDMVLKKIRIMQGIEKEAKPKKIDVVEEMDKIERRESLGEANP